MSNDNKQAISEAEKILQQIYEAYGSDSGVLFGIKNKDIVKAIIEFTLNRAEKHEALKEQNERLLNALKPFAKMANEIPDSKKGPVFGYNSESISIEDFREAQAAIQYIK